MATDFGIYIHVPYCRSKCLYCDFYSVGGRHEGTAFADALLREFAARRHILDDTSGPYTLYIGGGTPSLLDTDIIRRLCSEISESIGHAPVETTVEVNPEDVTRAKSHEWRLAGINRVSMGVQSLMDAELRRVGRRHDAAKARDAFAILRDDFDNVSLDMMFGLPLQSVDTLARTIDGFLAMNPEHISAYSLMYEEGTPLTRLRAKGSIPETPDETCLEMYRQVSGRLADAGYVHYELSNYARPGYESRHNTLYWEGKPYLGLGPGAHSYDGSRRRYAMKPDVRKYVASSCPEAFLYTEELGDTELREEMVMTRLRLRDGLDLQLFETRFGYDALRALLRRAQPHIAAGNLLHKKNRIALSSHGVMISDTVISDLF